MKILLNPDNGAEIKDLYLESVKYFDSSKNETFMPGTLVKLDDNVADFVVSIYDFVQEITKEAAVAHLEKTKNNKFKCDQCDFRTSAEIALMGHKRHHEKEAKLDDELGIPVIKGVKSDNQIFADTQAQIEAENAKDGLDVGEGLKVENRIPKVRF